MVFFFFFSERYLDNFTKKTLPCLTRFIHLNLKIKSYLIKYLFSLKKTNARLTLFFIIFFTELITETIL